MVVIVRIHHGASKGLEKGYGTINGISAGLFEWSAVGLHELKSEGRPGGSAGPVVQKPDRIVAEYPAVYDEVCPATCILQLNRFEEYGNAHAHSYGPWDAECIGVVTKCLQVSGKHQ